MLRFERRNHDSAESIDNSAIALAQETGYALELCRLLCMRGVFDKTTAEDFLKPSFSQFHDPFLFSQMELAVERIKLARESKEKVCIYGDYDVDGMCSTSILYSYLRYENYDVSYYIPSRKTEGYGMNSAAVEHLHELGVQLIITVDNGITAHTEVAHAQRLGMDVIITDHHACTDTPPECVAVICHTCAGETYPNHALCGAGTALKLVHALGGEDAMRAFIPYAGLASVADVVELSGENRVLVSFAINAINSGDCPIGIKALADVASQNRKKPITERDFAFGMSPRLNAAGRMSEATMGVELLCAQDYDKARDIAQKLDALNLQRREEEAAILEEAEAQIREMNLTDTRVIVLKSSTWNSGIVGIAAARIAEKYYRPTILLTQQDDILTGSARSIPEVDIYEAMYRFADLYIKFGGHPFAAGLTMKLESFETYRDSLNEYIINAYPVSTFVPKKYYDNEIELSELTVEFVNMLEKLAPFGEGNLRPVFLMRGVTFGKLSRIGSELNHLNGKICKGSFSCDMVAFDKSYMFDTLINAETCDIAFVPSVNEWGGSMRLQLRVLDFSPSSIVDIEGYFAQRSERFMRSFVNNIHENGTLRTKQVLSCTDALVKSSLVSSYDGTLVLCMDKKTAVRVTSALENVDCMADFAFGVPESGGFAFNTVLYAPIFAELRAFARNYYRIIVCGCISEKELCAVAEIFSNATLYLSKDSKKSDEAEEFISASDRASMGQIYTCATKIVKTGAMYKDELCRSIAETCSKNVAVCEFAIECFVELGLYFEDNNGRISPNTDCSRVELSDSQLYNTVANYVCTTVVLPKT